MPAAGGRDSKGETRVGEGQSRVCQLQVAGTLRARREWPVTSVPAAGGRDSICKTRVGEGQSRVCQLQEAGTQYSRREWVRASHECASCRWQGLQGRDESG